MPLISVIIPAYNVERYVEKCVRSVLNQSFHDFEILLIDDGATDLTPSICDKLGKLDERVRVFHKENGGLSDARNYGLDRMNGKYVTFIDSDDYVSTKYLSYLYNLMLKKENVQISTILYQELLENEKPSCVKSANIEVVSTEVAVRKMLLRCGLTHVSWGKLFDSILWKNIRFPVGQNYEDYATTYRIFSYAENIACSDAKLYYYIQHNKSIMHQKCSEKTLSVLDVADTETKFIIKKWNKNRIEAIDLQIAVYLKNLQSILNCGQHSFPKYQIRIIKKVRENAKILLSAKQVPFKDKVKIISLMLGKRIFIKVYNLCDKNI